jgi:hypothetical protein
MPAALQRQSMDIRGGWNILCYLCLVSAKTVLKDDRKPLPFAIDGKTCIGTHE